LPAIDHLPVVEDEAAIRPRTKEEVADRCLAIVICAVKGETGDDDDVKTIIRDFPRAKGAFSPEERRFIDATRPSRQDRTSFAWRYECMHVMLWALGYLEKLQPPSELCNVADEAGVLWKSGQTRFVAGAKLRPLGAILDQTDLYYRLHWAAVELRLKGEEHPAANEEIIMERHRALNWLVRYMDQEWDDVTTDT